MLHIFSTKIARLEVHTLETGKHFYNATCWFGRKNGKTYLVSNYHILKGLRVADGQPFHASSALPGRINVYAHVLMRQPTNGGSSHSKSVVPHKFDLDVSSRQIFWNDVLGSDVAAIDITQECTIPNYS